MTNLDEFDHPLDAKKYYLITNDAPDAFTYKTAPLITSTTHKSSYKPYTPQKKAVTQTPVQHEPINVQRRMFTNVEIQHRVPVPIYLTDISFKQYFARVDRRVQLFRLKTSLKWGFTAAVFLLWVARPTKHWFDTRVRGIKD